MTKHGKHNKSGRQPLGRAIEEEANTFHVTDAPQQELRQTPALDREALERKTVAEKVADGDPVAVIGTEVPAAGEAAKENPDSSGAAQQLPEAQTAAPADQVRGGFKLPKDFDIEASGYSMAQIIDAANAAHQANKAYCESIGDTSQVDWPDAKDWQHESAVSGVCYAITNNFPSPEDMHKNWMKEKVAAGWMFGLEKNPEAKTHPCIAPYSHLPAEQRKKDDIFRDTIMEVLGPRAAPAVKAKEEDQPRTDHLNERGKPVYLEEFVACLFLASVSQGSIDKDHVELIPFELASFIRSDPLAPDQAGLMHLKLKLKTVLLPDEDPRRVELAVKLFRTAISGLDAIEREDGEKNRLAQQEPFRPAHDRLDGDGPFDKDEGRFEKSDLGKALDKQRA